MKILVLKMRKNRKITLEKIVKTMGVRITELFESEYK